MRYRLRTLLIMLAIGPPMLAGAWWTRQRILEHYPSDFDKLIDRIQTTIRFESSWDDVGGPGQLNGLEESLSVVPVTEPEADSPIGNLRPCSVSQFAIYCG